MALHLHFGSRLDDLADALEGEFFGAWTDPLDPPRVVVPSPSVGKWLKLRWAGRGRTVMNLEATTLEAYLWESLAPSRGDRILRVPVLQQAVAGFLNEACLEDPDFREVRRFLAGRDGKIDPTLKVQLAREVARAFLEYEYNRPSVWGGTGWVVRGVDQTWPEAPYFATLWDEEESATERWQRKLHGWVFGPSGPLAGSGWYGLPRLHRIRREEGLWAPRPGTTHLFSIDKVSHYHRNLILELAEAREMHLHLVNPCMEFWEDLDTARRPGRSGRRGRIPFGRMSGGEFQSSELPRNLSGEPADPVLLKLWGRTARENTVLWCQAANHDFQDVYREPLADGTSLLRVVQTALLRRHGGPRIEPLEHASGTVDGPVEDDGSVRILACPESWREMEAVRDAILQWLSEDPSRGPGDAVVYLPDPASRLAEIEGVFGSASRNPPARMPYSVLGVDGAASRWGQGARMLLELARNGLDRRGFLEFLGNPLVLARRNLEPGTETVWCSWLDGAGFCHSWDRLERLSGGEDPAHASDAHTLRAAVLRLALGGLAGGPVDLGLSSSIEGAGLPPWIGAGSDDPGDLERFLSAIEDLRADLWTLSGSAPLLPLADAARRFLSICDRWMDVGADERESPVRREFASALDALELAGREPTSLDEIAEVLRHCVAEELPGSGRSWSGTLTFAPLRPGMVLPHGLVVVAGLSADRFPGEPRTGALDLLARRRIVGDADPVADNRHAFLLGLLAARDRLVLSWQARDLQKDEIRPPSSVVLEFEAALAAGFLADGADLRRAVPLLARTGGILPGDPPVWETPCWEPAERPGPIPGFGDPGREAEAPPRTVDLRGLRKFLENALFHRVKNGLDADFEDDDGSDVEEGALWTESREGTMRFRILVREILSDREGLWGADDLVVRILSEMSWETSSPEGDFLRGEIRRIAPGIRRIREGFDGMFRRGEGEVLLDRSLGSLLEGGRCAVELPGGRSIGLEGRIAQAWLPSDPEAPLLLVETTKGGRKTKPPASKVPMVDGFRPFLAAAALRAGGWTRGISVVWVPRAPEGEIHVEAIPEDASAPWLRNVVADALDPACCEFLPARQMENKRDRESVEESLEGGGGFIRAEPLRLLLEPELPPLDPPEWDALLRRRFGPLLGDRE